MANDYGQEPATPAIPDLRTGKTGEALPAIKEWIEVRQGKRGNQLDRGVTMRDLLNAGIATPNSIQGLFSDPLQIPIISGATDPAIPPTPTDLSAAGAISTIILTWEFARGYSRHAYFEVWRSDTDAIGFAELIAQPYGTTYADVVGSSAVFYYWVRAVSDAGTSPFNAVLGTLGETALNPQEVIDAVNDGIDDSGLLEQLTIKVNADGRVTGFGPASTPNDDGDSTTFTILADRLLVAAPAVDGIIPDSPFFVQATPTTVNGVAVPKGTYMTNAYIMNGVITNAKIGNLAVDNAKIANVNVAKLTAGQLGVSEYLESTSYLAGDTGFRIHGNGNAEFNNATVRGTVFATAGLIGGNTINATGIQSPTWNGSTAGWRISSDGAATFNSGTFRGSITGASGTFSGNLHAGQFTTGSYTGYAWPAGTGVGTYLGPNGMLMGNVSTGRYLQITETGDIYTPALTVVGGTLAISQVNAINTLNVAGNAITGNSAAAGGAGTLPAGGLIGLCAAALTMPAGGSGVVVLINVSLVAASPASATMRIYRGAAEIGTTPISMQSGYVTTFTVAHLDTSPTVGTETYSFYISNPTTGPGSMVAISIQQSSIVITGSKR